MEKKPSCSLKERRALYWNWRVHRLPLGTVGHEFHFKQHKTALMLVVIAGSSKYKQQYQKPVPSQFSFTATKGRSPYPNLLLCNMSHKDLRAGPPSFSSSFHLCLILLSLPLKTQQHFAGTSNLYLTISSQPTPSWWTFLIVFVEDVCAKVDAFINWHNFQASQPRHKSGARKVLNQNLGLCTDAARSTAMVRRTNIKQLPTWVPQLWLHRHHYTGTMDHHLLLTTHPDCYRHPHVSVTLLLDLYDSVLQ